MNNSLRDENGALQIPRDPADLLSRMIVTLQEDEATKDIEKTMQLIHDVACIWLQDLDQQRNTAFAKAEKEWGMN